MVKARVKEVLDSCFQRGAAQGFWSPAAGGTYAVEVPKHEAQGDFSTNMALVVAGREKKRPRDVAQQLADMLAEHNDLFAKVEVAGPGFVNLFINPTVWQAVLVPVCTDDTTYGASTIGDGRRVLVEFVSANPTGPLSIGHGRQALLGDAIARLLTLTGHEVTREYYYNDAGRQMRVLGESTRARYLELSGRPAPFPEDGYQGDYIRDIAAAIYKEAGDSLADCQDITPFKDKAETAIFADIRNTLDRLGIRFDSYYNEHSLYENGLIDDVVNLLRAKGLVYDRDGAV